LLEVSDPVERVARALRLRGGLSPEDLGQLVLDVVASEQNEALRTATALALYLGVQRVHGLPAIVAETLAIDVRRVLRPVTRKLSVPSRQIDPTREVGRITARLSKRGSKTEKTRDGYTRNLLEALLPDGYSGSSPDLVYARFTELWKRFALDDVDEESA
jgi:hypothetical protein